LNDLNIEIIAKGGIVMLEIFPLYISSFEQERLIRIYLPKNYTKENQSYPVLYMHDGQNVFQDDDANGGTSLNLEKYLDEHELEVIVVGIDQNREERINEYYPWKGGEYSKKIVGKESIDLSSDLQLITDGQASSIGENCGEILHSKDWEVFHGITHLCFVCIFSLYEYWFGPEYTA